MAVRKRKFDRRLLGTWKSDRRRTFKEFTPRPGTSEKSLRKLKSLFGKLVVRFGRRRMHSDYDGVQESNDYQVLGNDSESVVLRYYDDVWKEHRIRQIHFEGDYYWVWASGIREYFKRIKARA